MRWSRPPWGLRVSVGRSAPVPCRRQVAAGTGIASRGGATGRAARWASDSSGHQAIKAITSGDRAGIKRERRAGRRLMTG